MALRAEEQKHALETRLSELEHRYTGIYNRDTGFIITTLKDLADLRKQMNSTGARGIGHTISRHDEFFSKLAGDVCKYMDDLILEYDTQPKQTTEFIRGMYGRVKSALELFRQAGLQRNGYLTKAGIDFELYTTFEQLLVQHLKGLETTQHKPIVEGTSQGNTEIQDRLEDYGAQSLTNTGTYHAGNVYALKLRAKYTNVEPNKREKIDKRFPKKPHHDTALEQEVIEAWKARGVKEVLPRDVSQAVDWYTTVHRKVHHPDNMKKLVIMDYMAERGYPNVI